MTVLIGILCKDGVIVASDSAATLGASGQMTVGQQSVRKVVKCNDHILFCSTGAVGIGQVLAEKVLQIWNSNQLNAASVDHALNHVGTIFSNTLRPYLETATFQHKILGEAAASICKTMIALPVGNAPCLFTFDVNGAPERATPELPFVALGSGQLIADPFLAFLKRVLWKDTQPTLAEGRLAAVWTIDHVRRTTPGGVGGEIQLGTLAPKPGGKPVAEIFLAGGDGGIDEHLQRIASAEKALLNEVMGIKPGDAKDVPQP